MMAPVNPGGTAGTQLQGTALPGISTPDNPNFILQGVLVSLPVATMIDIAAMAGQPGEGRPGATDLTLLPTESITYSDGGRAHPVSLLLSDKLVLGVWQGRAPANSPLVAADWMLPYFMAESGGRGGGQRTHMHLFAAPPGGAIYRPPWRLQNTLLEWTQLAEEVSHDARAGQPDHPLYGILRAPPITTYRAVTDADPSTPDEHGEPPGHLEVEFAQRLGELLGGSQPFFVSQAATEAGVSTALARFFLRKLAARHQVITQDKTR